MADASIPWVDGDWVAASDRELELRNRELGHWWASQPVLRPWFKTIVKMQTWENEPWRAKRKPLGYFDRVNGSSSKVWWYCKDKSTMREMYFEMPFLTQYYFQNFLFLSTEASVSDFVRNYNGTYPSRLSFLQNSKPDIMEMDEWISILRLLDLPNDVDYAVRREILDAVKLLRHKAIHRETIDVDSLWDSMKFPELLNDWNRAFEIQQVFKCVLDDPSMEADTRLAADRLLFGPRMPPATLLQAHTWLQHSQEKICFRFVQSNYPEMLKSRKWEWPEQCELQRSWEDALFEISFDDHSLYPEECPEEDQLFYHQQLRKEVLLQGRNLRDATSHRDHLNETFLRKHALNGILLAIMLNDREQTIEIEATIEAFLTSKTKYQVLTRLRDACAYDRPIPGDQLGERRKRESLAAFLGDKEVCIPETPLRSAAGHLTTDESPEDTSISTVSDSDLARRETTLTEYDLYERPFSETALWVSAVKKFVLGDSMHEVYGKSENFSVYQRPEPASLTEDEWQYYDE